MGKRKYAGKIKLNSLHMRKIIDFAKKINKFSNLEKVDYFKLIKRNEIDLLSEIVLNFIKCNIKHDSSSFKLLYRVKRYVYMLASKKVSTAIKKKILQSVKGLNILNILLPLLINQL